MKLYYTLIALILFGLLQCKKKGSTNHIAGSDKPLDTAGGIPGYILNKNLLVFDPKQYTPGSEIKLVGKPGAVQLTSTVSEPLAIIFEKDSQSILNTVPLTQDGSFRLPIRSGNNYEFLIIEKKHLSSFSQLDKGKSTTIFADGSISLTLGIDKTGNLGFSGATGKKLGKIQSCSGGIELSCDLKNCKFYFPTKRTQPLYFTASSLNEGHFLGWQPDLHPWEYRLILDGAKSLRALFEAPPANNHIVVVTVFPPPAGPNSIQVQIEEKQAKDCKGGETCVYNASSTITLEGFGESIVYYPTQVDASTDTDSITLLMNTDIHVFVTKASRTQNSPSLNFKDTVPSSYVPDELKTGYEKADCPFPTIQTCQTQSYVSGILLTFFLGNNPREGLSKRRNSSWPNALCPQHQCGVCTKRL